MSENKKNNRSPWSWIPTLYFAEGIPNAVVNVLAIVMLMQLGMSNANIAFFTSVAYLPWAIKPVWSPIVDMLKTKRWWIIITQIALGLAFGSVALLLNLPVFLQISLILLIVIAFISATHDIAADGFYMLGLAKHQQSYFVGIRNTFYRVAMVTVQSGLIIMAGLMQSWTGLKDVEIKITSLNDAVTEIVLPKAPQIAAVSENDKLAFVITSDNVNLSTSKISSKIVDSIKVAVEKHNSDLGFVLKEEKKSKAKITTKSTLTNWLTKTFNPKKYNEDNKNDNEELHNITDKLVENGVVVGITLNKQPQKDEDVVLILESSDGLKIISDKRLVFNSENWNQLAYVMVQSHANLNSANGWLKGTSGNIPLSWAIIFFILAGLFAGLFVYHRFILPKPEDDKPAAKGKNLLKEFLLTFKTFFQKRNVVLLIFFLLLYRFGESQLLKISPIFVQTGRETGGLGLSTIQYGTLYGLFGVIMMLLGGILGGLAASKKGLKYWLWPMALSINIPHLLYVYLAYAQPSNLFLIGSCIAVEQFFYGFAFAAYTLYMLYACRDSGEHKTAHFAICTGFMALSLVLPGMISGWLQECLGYQNFFIWIMICAIPGLLPVLFVKVDPKFGIKEKE
ncbi:MAG: MFS transporter [Prevotellaceae bacterium]|jgi:PAT family beta-lactamase induction signal transducer AmpG|nr:MFS transporter [Prevotellaceae bacterium]